jgi:hypothetical protein
MCVSFLDKTFLKQMAMYYKAEIRAFPVNK